eukprot:361975-Chlamydomonas_euryale.AAC.5
MLLVTLTLSLQVSWPLLGGVFQAVGTAATSFIRASRTRLITQATPAVYSHSQDWVNVYAVHVGHMWDTCGTLKERLRSEGQNPILSPQPIGLKHPQAQAAMAFAKG